MLAFEVEIDGRKVVLAGVEDWSILNLTVTASRFEPEAPVPGGWLDARVGGMSLPDEEGIRHHFRWATHQLRIGSTITMQIVDSATVDMPLKRYRSDAEVQEFPLTDDEVRDLRYQDYLELKAEFEK